MSLKNNRHGFALSGTAFLLLVPAMILVASYLSVTSMGGEIVAIQNMSDKVSYTGNDINRTLERMLEDRLPTDELALDSLEENYHSSTGLSIDIGLHPLWIKVDEEDTGVTHWAGTKYCLVEEIGSGRWRYKFEDQDLEEDNVDWSYEEPILLVERLDGELRITIENHKGGYKCDIYYDNQKLWTDAGGSDNPHVGESEIVNEVIKSGFENVPQLNKAIIYVRNPSESIRYTSTLDME